MKKTEIKFMTITIIENKNEIIENKNEIIENHIYSHKNNDISLVKKNVFENIINKSNTDDLLYYLLIAEKCQRYEDMYIFAEAIIEKRTIKKQELTDDEQKMWYIALIGKYFDPGNDALEALDIYKNIEKDNYKTMNVQHIIDYRNIIETEIFESYYNIIKYIDEKLLKNCQGSESKILYSKIKLDLFRAIGHFAKGKERSNAIDNTVKIYENTIPIAKNWPINKVSTIDFFLKAATLFYELVNDRKKAIEIAEMGTKKFEKEFQYTFEYDGHKKDGDYNDCFKKYQLIKQFLDEWKFEF